MDDESSVEWIERQLANYCGRFSDEQVDSTLKRLAEFGLTAWDGSIMESIYYGYGQVDSKEGLAKMAFGNLYPKNPVAAETAIERCFQKGWIQVTTVTFLKGMQQELEAGGYFFVNGILGENNRYVAPEMSAGLISFTHAGVEQIFRYWGINPSEDSHWAIGSGDDDGTSPLFGTSMEACREAMEADVNRIVESPTAIGRWCDKWWWRFESGFRMRVVSE